MGYIRFWIRCDMLIHRTLLKKIDLANLKSDVDNFEIQEYYQNEPKFNGVYSRNNDLK